MQFVIKVTKENIPFIVDCAKAYGLNLSYIRDNLEYFLAEETELYVVKSGHRPTVTFTDMPGSMFHEHWKIVSNGNPETDWVEIASN